MEWTQDYQVQVQDTDFNRLVTMGSMMRYFQNTANLQMEGQRPSYLELFDKGYAFVLSSVRVKAIEPMHWPDCFSCQTWAVQTKGYFYPRCYRLIKEGRIIAEADSIWALIRTEDRKPVPQGTVELSYDMGEPLKLDMDPRVKIPVSCQMIECGIHTVSYHEIDVNQHMNHTYYPDVFCSFLPMKEQWISEFAIRYIHEAPYGSTIRVFVGQDNGRYYFRSICEDGNVNAEAYMCLKK